LVDKLYATTLDENIATIKALQKLGFKRDIEKDEAILAMMVFIDQDDSVFGDAISGFVLSKNECKINGITVERGTIQWEEQKTL
jgi:RimJ/RimL family protein N-acetyltransferase